MADLTEEEIADYRGLLRDGAADVIGAATITRLLDEIDHRRKRDERVLALLKRVEAQGGTYREESACPECGAIDQSDFPARKTRIDHKPDCELAALLEAQ